VVTLSDSNDGLLMVERSDMPSYHTTRCYVLQVINPRGIDSSDGVHGTEFFLNIRVAVNRLTVHRGFLVDAVRRTVLSCFLSALETAKQNIM